MLDVVIMIKRFYLPASLTCASFNGEHSQKYQYIHYINKAESTHYRIFEQYFSLLQYAYNA